MTGQLVEERQTLFARPQERRQAHELLEQLGGTPRSLTVETPAHRKAPVPRELTAIIGRVLEIMAHGGTVMIGSLPEELTTTAAAEQLGISRPTLMKMIRNQEIASHMVGSHHRLKSADVLAFKRERLQRQRQALEELRELEDELDAL